MADPKWKILTRAQADVVPYLSNIPDGFLLDSLLAEKLLINENYEELLKGRLAGIGNEAARELVVMLKKTPPGSYDKFCQVLLSVNGGKDVYDRLIKDEGSSKLSKRHHAIVFCFFLARYMQEPETDTDGGGVRGEH